MFPFFFLDTGRFPFRIRATALSLFPLVPIAASNSWFGHALDDVVSTLFPPGPVSVQLWYTHVPNLLLVLFLFDLFLPFIVA